MFRKGFYINSVIAFVYAFFLFFISWNQSGGDMFLIMGLSFFFTIHLLILFILDRSTDIKGALLGWVVVLLMSVIVFMVISQNRQSVVPHTTIGISD